MFTKTLIKRTLESNSDVPNTPRTAKQDCSSNVKNWKYNKRYLIHIN